MTQAERLVAESKHFPKALKGVFPKNPQLFSVDPGRFEIKRGIQFNLNFTAKSRIRFVAEETEKQQIEHSIMFYGRKQGKDYLFEDAEIARGTRDSVSFSPVQNARNTQFLKISNTEIIYGHTHVASGSVYNHLSLTDLRYFAERALATHRDVYAMLITKDRYTIVMYSYRDREFFRIQG